MLKVFMDLSIVKEKEFLSKPPQNSVLSQKNPSKISDYSNKIGCFVNLN